jgi:hypothetical protein
MQIVKVSKIKKGLTFVNELKESEEPLKCPKCAIVHIISAVDKKMYVDVLGVQDVKNRLKKKVDVHEQKIFVGSSAKKDKSQSRAVSLAENSAMCHICIPSS